MDTLNYHHLRYFWAVARSGSLTRASAELHITPQTVSSQIRDLERSLGTDLFDRSGRGLTLTQSGRAVFGYADEIFTIGQELADSVRNAAAQRPVRLAIGVADVLPKLIAYRLIEPALNMDEPVRVVCHEGASDRLLADLSVHALDLVLSDAPIPANVKVRAFNHLLGECGVTLMAGSALATRYRQGFPGSLNGAPLLLPQKGTTLRQSLDQWCADQGIRPVVVAEFDDSALLKVFGQSGAGIFAVPTVIEAEVRRQYRVRRIGTVTGVVERFYAISVERRINHPAVARICDSARSQLFA